MASRSSVPPAGAHAVLRVVLALLPVLVLVQAVIAGRALFGGWSITVHGVLGNVTFAVAVGALALAMLTRHRLAAGWSAVLVVLLTVQIGLGYMGRQSLEAASWHVPVGVAAFGVTVYLAGVCSRS